LPATTREKEWARPPALQVIFFATLNAVVALVRLTKKARPRKLAVKVGVAAALSPIDARDRIFRTRRAQLCGVIDARVGS